MSEMIESVSKPPAILDKMENLGSHLSYLPGCEIEREGNAFKKGKVFGFCHAYLQQKWIGTTSAIQYVEWNVKNRVI